jgi:hypothetical protein
MSKSAIILTLALALALLLCTVITYAESASYDKVYVQASQPYLRLGMDDEATITVQLLYRGDAARISDVPVILKVMNNKDLVAIDRLLLITDANGTATTNISIMRPMTATAYMPALVQISATAENYMASVNIYVTQTGSISGYVVDDKQNTILGAGIKVYQPDGKPANYITETYSGNGSGTSMGKYSVEKIPAGVGKFRIEAEKDGLKGSAFYSGENTGNINIVIPGYVDMGTTPMPFGKGNNNISPTPTVAPKPSESVPMPTSTTNTIIIVILIVSISYVGIKIYRKYSK